VLVLDALKGTDGSEEVAGLGLFAGGRQRRRFGREGGGSAAGEGRGWLGRSRRLRFGYGRSGGVERQQRLMPRGPYAGGV
jgi:hypothetical protein